MDINDNWGTSIDHLPDTGIQGEYNTVKPALNGPFIKRKSVLNGNIFRTLD
jgi:hypothetical protein